MTDNEIAKHFQSFCKELVEWIDGDKLKPNWVKTSSGLCSNFSNYVDYRCKPESLGPVYDWLTALFSHNNLSSTIPFNSYNKDQPHYYSESNKFTNPDRLAFIRKYANEFPKIN